MIGYVVRIDSAPRISIYSNSTLRKLISGIKYQRLISVSSIRKESSVWGNGENANVTVTIDNGDGTFSKLWKFPPLKRKAIIERYENGKVKQIFSGVVVSLEPQSTLTLYLEA